MNVAATTQSVVLGAHKLLCKNSLRSWEARPVCPASWAGAALGRKQGSTSLAHGLVRALCVWPGSQGSFTLRFQLPRCPRQGTLGLTAHQQSVTTAACPVSKRHWVCRPSAFPRLSWNSGHAGVAEGGKQDSEQYATRFLKRSRCTPPLCPSCRLAPGWEEGCLALREPSWIMLHGRSGETRKEPRSAGSEQLLCLPLPESREVVCAAQH